MLNKSRVGIDTSGSFGADPYYWGRHPHHVLLLQGQVLLFQAQGQARTEYAQPLITPTQALPSFRVWQMCGLLVIVATHAHWSVAMCRLQCTYGFGRIRDTNADTRCAGTLDYLQSFVPRSQGHVSLLPSLEYLVPSLWSSSLHSPPTSLLSLGPLIPRRTVCPLFLVHLSLPVLSTSLVTPQVIYVCRHTQYMPSSVPPWASDLPHKLSLYKHCHVCHTNGNVQADLSLCPHASILSQSQSTRRCASHIFLCCQKCTSAVCT